MKNSEFKNRIHNLIPGGAHTYSKGDDQFPVNAPPAIAKGKGAWLWDLEDNKYLDCSMGLTSVSLGHAYEPVIEAVADELQLGVNFQRPSYIELEMAERFLSLLPQHDMVKFAKNGSTATTAAVKLARAHTGRKLVAFPHDHPFYSYDDWFIGKTACDKGVPEDIAALSVTFKSCDINSLKELFDKYPGQIAVVITEPEKPHCSTDGTCENCGSRVGDFLKQAIELTRENGAVFILDEMVTGFKTDFPGSISKHNIDPDLATWGKGIANGFSFCALTGKKEIMELGGIRRAGEEKVFLISSTHGAETHALRAGIKTIEEFEKHNVIEHIRSTAKSLKEKCVEVLTRHNLLNSIELQGNNWMLLFLFKNADGQIDQVARTYFMQEMIAAGVLFQGAFVPCFAHKEEEVQFFVKAFEKAAVKYAEGFKAGFNGRLIGPAAKGVFRRIL
jgi:spore coat polysaccharide biosynthesis protein SpsF